MDLKPLFSSKRFWVGVLALLTGVSLILTGEKTWQVVAPEIILIAIGLVQTIIAVLSGSELSVGGKSIKVL